MGIASIFSVSYLFGRIVYNIGHFFYFKILQFRVVGFNFEMNKFDFDPFFINTESFIFMVVFVYILVMFAILFGRKMAQERKVFSLSVLYFFPIFGIVAPVWFLKAIYNTILSRKPSWR